MNRNISRISLVTLALSFCFCLPASSIIYRHDADYSKMEQLAAQEEFDCVGSVVLPGKGQHKGSCVLIDKQYVLSAAHVFMEKNKASGGYKDTVTTSEGRTRVAVFYDRYSGNIEDYQFRFGKKMYKGTAMNMHPLYGAPPHLYREYDLVLIRLEEPVEDVTPATLYKKRDEQNKPVVCVGYGGQRKGNEHGGSQFAGRKLAGTNIIDSLGGAKRSGFDTRLYADFDSPDTVGYNRTGSAIPTKYEAMSNGGDSGGGVFIKDGNGYKLAGITSGLIFHGNLDGIYGSEMNWMRVSVFVPWIQETVEQMEPEEAID